MSQCGRAKQNYVGKSYRLRENWVSFSLLLKWVFSIGYRPCSGAAGGRKRRLLFWDLLHPPLLSSVPSPWLRPTSLSQGWGLESEHSSSLTPKPSLILEWRSGVDIFSALRIKKNKIQKKIKKIKWGLTHERGLGSAPAKKNKKQIKFLIKI